MLKTVNKILDGMCYFLCNHIILHIPIWTIRKCLYKMCGMKIGRDARILMNTIVVCPWKISIGERTYVNEYCHLDGRGGLTIKEDVSISIYTLILTATHSTTSETFAYKQAPVVIEKNVWTGARCCILPGTTLKERSVVAAQSLVLPGVYEVGAIYSGVPAKKIKDRELNKSYSLTLWNPYFR